MFEVVYELMYTASVGHVYGALKLQLSPCCMVEPGCCCVRSCCGVPCQAGWQSRAGLLNTAYEAYD